MESQPQLPFDVTSRKHGGHRNSVAAHERVAPGIPAMKERIRLFIYSQGSDGATPKEIAKAFDKPLHTISGRFKQMRDDGVIFDSGRDRDNSTVHVYDRRWINGSERTA